MMLQVALRGREAILAAVLPEKGHERYRAVRDLLLQARAEKEKAGVRKAEAAYREDDNREKGNGRN